MAEAFINMTILIFCKDEIRNDPARYQAFLRAKIPDRLALLSEYCDGFVRGIDFGTEAYANFKRIIDKRNFALHGNVDPIRESIETVFFDGKRPLFSVPGHNIEKLFEHIEAVNKPRELVAEYEAVHIFLAEIADCLSSRHKTFFSQVINDGYPGYEVKKQRTTRILPDHVITGFTQGMRCDDELNVNW